MPLFRHSKRRFSWKERLTVRWKISVSITAPGYDLQKTVISENYVHDPNHWLYLYTYEGSYFITVKNNFTEGEKFLKNANGPMVNDSIKTNTGRK